MPAASLSSSISWAVYLASSLALVAACSPLLVGMKDYSCDYAAAKTARGAAAVVNALEPGMTVRFSFHPPTPDGTIELEGRSLTTSWCGRSSTFGTRWSLPDMNMTGGSNYYLRLAGSEVEVFELV